MQLSSNITKVLSILFIICLSNAVLFAKSPNNDNYSYPRQIENTSDENSSIVQPVVFVDSIFKSLTPELVKITGDSVIIIGNPSTLTATEGFDSYVWSTNDTTQSITVYPEEETKYWVDVISIDGIPSSDTITVMVLDYILDHSPLDIIHEPDQPDSMWVILGEGSTPEWSTGSTDNYIIVNPEINTLYSLFVKVDSDTVQQLDYNVIMANVIEFSYDTVCMGDSTTLINTSVTGDTITNILWDLDGDAQFNDGEGDTVKFQFSNGGNHLVGMRTYFKNSPMEVTYNAVPVGDYPIAEFTYSNVCAGNSTSFIDESTVEIDYIVEYFWTFGDGNTSPGNEPFNTYLAVDVYQVELIVWSNIGCSDTVQKQVEIFSSPVFELKTDDDVIIQEGDTAFFQEGGTVTINISFFDTYDSVIWNNGEKGASYTIAEEGEFFVNVYDNGCESQQNFITSWGSTPPQPTGDEIMNLFTPNGDGYNDNWKVNGNDISFPIKVNIYNRSGKQVYANNDYDNTWDGQYNGNPLPQATYYYIIEDANGTIIKGPVTIIR